MFYHLNSKVFFDEFLVHESDNDILKAQYVIVSHRIRLRDRNDNMISGTNLLFPNPNVLSVLTDEELEEKYYNQLMGCKPFIATLIKGSIEKKYNIIFLCSKKEDRIGYLEMFSNFVYMEFGYPCYEYSKYRSGASYLLKYNKDKILKKCNKILQETRKNYENKEIANGQIGNIMKEYKDMSKKELKKNLVKRGLYTDGMSKKEMLDTIELFIK